MPLITTKTHALLDFTSGILLVATPWVFAFHDGSIANWVSVIYGVIILIVSIITNYEGGFVRIISMRTHLTIDVVAGIILMASPWLLGFADRIFLPHLIIGGFELMIGLLTDRTPFLLGKEMSVRTAHHSK
ncbi:SPW repeat-containing protein [Chitinophaga sp. YR627]|uniref:SPW repeat domain-containing protein n=1 Tax=Chitinophaga sp. YR627 TaxID=1881041 RepID=UPI0008E753A3|nr:SPW repeat protein [Chitinophaga sp. YR627]SFM66311.1 SPW repeat-containing protein [Chitinophaga sp. YR627]